MPMFFFIKPTAVIWDIYVRSYQVILARQTGAYCVLSRLVCRPRFTVPFSMHATELFRPMCFPEYCIVVGNWHFLRTSYCRFLINLYVIIVTIPVGVWCFNRRLNPSSCEQIGSAISQLVLHQCMMSSAHSKETQNRHYISLFVTSAADKGRKKVKTHESAEKIQQFTTMIINSISTWLTWNWPIITQISISRIHTDVILQVSDFNKIGPICRFIVHINLHLCKFYRCLNSSVLKLTWRIRTDSLLLGYS